MTFLPERETTMKQVAQNYKSGELAVLDVPAPSCAPGGVLVRSLYSLISTGTELMKVGEARLSLLGYSLCGVVVEVGAGAEEFSVGQLVAAAGNEFALHAEYNWIPTNLCVPVPDGVPP